MAIDKISTELNSLNITTNSGNTVANIKGGEYEETKYFRPNINVTASDVRLVEKEMKKINLNVFINKKK